jgi:DNA-binding NarL/FixJ family response regulator
LTLTPTQGHPDGGTPGELGRWRHETDTAARRRPPRVRSLARRLLTTDGFEVVGEAANGQAAIDAARELRPDVVLLDVQLPGIDGFEVATRLRDGTVGPVVVLTSTRDRALLGATG